MQHKGNCEFCGKVFYGQLNQRFCRPGCSLNHRRALERERNPAPVKPVRYCQMDGCKNPLPAKASHLAKYCGKECTRTARNQANNRHRERIEAGVIIRQKRETPIQPMLKRRETVGCVGCKFARRNTHSFRGVECIAEVYSECQPDLAWKRLYWRPVDAVV